MSRRLLLSRSATAVFALLAALLAPSPAQASDGPLRILLTGDSITQGFHGDYTWRYRLDKEFIRQGVAVDLVGSRKSPYVKPGWTTAQYADPHFDTDHFALASSTLRQQATLIKAEVEKQDPDVIVLACGVNDLRNGATPAQTDIRLRDWIAAARAAKPDVRIVLSPVLDALDAARPWLHQAIVDYDRLALTTVNELSTPDSPITAADTTRGWSVLADTAENLHPTATGETLIAQRVAETFHQLGYLPQSPNIYRPTVWNRSALLRATLRDGRAVLTWDSQALTAGHIWIHRVGYAASASPLNYGGGTMTTSVLAPLATYEFRVQYVRGRMLTPWGPVTRLSTPALARPGAVTHVAIDAAGVHWTRSALAARYLVKFQRGHSTRWITRRTSALSVSATKVTNARVWAVNRTGSSSVRRGAR